MILCVLVLLFSQYTGEQNCAAVIATPITAHSDTLTTCDVYKYCAFLHIYKILSPTWLRPSCCYCQQLPAVVTQRLTEGPVVLVLLAHQVIHT